MKKSALTTLASAVLLAILSILIAVPAQAATRNIACGDGGSFDIVGTKIFRHDGDGGCRGDVTIPADVTEIADAGFYGCRGYMVGNVTFEAGSQLRIVGFDNFMCMTGASIELPSGLRRLGAGAFKNSALTSLSIPGTVEYFGGTTSRILESVIFEPTTATSLYVPTDAFQEIPNLKSVTFKGPTKWTGMLGKVKKDNYNFMGWSTSLGGSIVASPVTGFGSSDVTIYPNLVPQVITDTPCALGGTFKTIDNAIHESHPDCAGAITIPANVTKIDFMAFAGRAITQVNYAPGSNLTTIGGGAFERTKLTSITLPSSVITIERGAFARIPGLTSVTIPSTVLNFGETFGESGLENLVIEPRTVPGGTIARDFLGYTRLLRSVTFKGPIQLGSEPTHELYANDFLGWSTSPNGPVVSVPLSVAASDSLTLYPHSSPRTYNANYDSKGGSPVAAGLIIGGDIQFPTPPTRTGYDLSGWYQYPWDVDPITRWDFNYDAYLSARWTPKTYTVNLISNGGSSVPPASFITDGAISSKPTAPVRRGYVFDGWAATQAGDALTFPYSPGVLENITFYARWIPDHVVSFDSKGGSAVPFDYFSTGGQIESVPEVSTRAGYTLLGWSTTEGGDVVQFPYAPGVTVDITLYAIWDANTYAVNLNTTGGLAMPAVSFRTDGDIPSDPSIPVRVGYTFVGWALTDGGTALAFPYVPGVIENITLFATWTRDPFKPELISGDVISGTGFQSTILSAAGGSWLAYPEAVVSYQWYRCDKAVAAGLSALPTGSKCEKITGANTSNYKVVVPDAGKYLTAFVEAKNRIGSTFLTAATFRALPLKAPSKIALPVGTGTAKANALLTGTLGTWAGNPVPKATVQWFRCEKDTKAIAKPVPGSAQCQPIGGATKVKYKLKAADKGKFVTVQITAKNTEGEAVSTAKAQHVVLEPNLVDSPVISGAAGLNKSLSANKGTWLAYPTAKTTLQWYRCNRATSPGAKKFSGGSGCKAIDGATRGSYRTSTADEGKYIAVLVSATNSAGTKSVTTRSTDKIE